MQRLVALVLVLVGCASHEPARIAIPSDEARCSTCHAHEVEEWRGSQHHAAFTSPDFRASWQSEPRAYCVDCHAPRHALGAAGLQAGVGCADCHEGLANHPARPATTRSCAGCHDFPVPNERAILQATAREHAASDYAAVPCAGCHAPTRDGRRDHRFASSRDPAKLAAALAVTPLGFDGTQVSVALQARGVGHKFPTGDLYRRITVLLTATRGGRIVCDRTVYLQRDWDEHRRSLRAHDEESFATDTRLGSSPLRIDAVCTEAPDRVRVNVDYARGASAHGDAFVAFEELALLDVSFDVHAP